MAITITATVKHGTLMPTAITIISPLSGTMHNIAIIVNSKLIIYKIIIHYIISLYLLMKHVTRQCYKQSDE